MAHTEVDFTYQEAVRTLGVTPEKLDHLIDEGKITVITTPAQMLVPRESILRYLATVTSVGKEKKKAAAPAKEAPAKAAPVPKAEAKAAAPAAEAPAEATATAEATPAPESPAAPAAEATPAVEAAVPAAESSEAKE
jgi:hypothetical protein